MKAPIAIFWFRRDLRLTDNAALYYALKSGLPVAPLFIFDREILDALPRKDRRVVFIHRQIEKLAQELTGKTFIVEQGKPLEVWEKLLQRYNVRAVFTNRDYEPQAKTRDAAVQNLLAQHGASFHAYKDQVIFDGDEVLTADAKPYTVFTPYKKRWLAALKDFYLKAYPSALLLDRLAPADAPQPIPSLQDLGFEDAKIDFPPPFVADDLLRHYAERRDFPAKNGTSRLGLHLRFGTISIRQTAAQALATSDVFLSELIWRDFYAMILDHFPHAATGAFKREYDAMPWRNDESDFVRWQTGQTGYPLVDAGMRELNETGYMHNRVRMVVASFLTKHLLIDWRWGEAYFAEKLLDFDLASNNGGWQWAAGTGCDAAPYFRIFNPAEQTKKFDPALQYVRRWVPELDGFRYPTPMVDHKFARQRALNAYQSLRSGAAF